MQWLELWLVRNYGIQLNGVPFAIFHLSAFGCDVCTDANVFLP